MYPASDAFHTAVQNGNEQKTLLIFKDCVFTDDDISVENGITFNDYFNTEEDLSIGQALSNEITFTLFNDDRLLNGYEFGEFVATMGVQISESSYAHQGNAYMVTANATYIGQGSYPFILRNGTALSSQPSFPVRALLGYQVSEENLYIVIAFSGDGRYVIYNDRTGANITSQHPLNSFMCHKSENWIGKGMFYNKDNRRLSIRESGTCKWYEFVPLGVFLAERPNAPDVIQIDMTCYDFMQKFDDDMPTASELEISYPISIGELYAALCTYVGVRPAQTEFINARAILDEEPEDFESVTMREVLKWIAEAAAANAKFNRDGELELMWLENTNQSYEATDYSEFNPYWYETKNVTKLYNRDTAEGTEATIGSGDEYYLIQDNPLLRGVT